MNKKLPTVSRPHSFLRFWAFFLLKIHFNFSVKKSQCINVKLFLCISTPTESIKQNKKKKCIEKQKCTIYQPIDFFRVFGYFLKILYKFPRVKELNYQWETFCGA